jgi:predicted Ser/Thr protein kinase/tetratricopeptide (TPR) repeat protein
LKVSQEPLPQWIGRYEVIDRLGHGGMGIVYLGRDPKIGRRVAIKLLRIEDDDLHERFLLEARAAGNLNHRNIVTIHDFGEHEGQPFIVMEFVEGTTLGDRIRSGPPLELAQKLTILEELCSGLDHAHNFGLVHRDVKPANIIVNVDGLVKILDFGIARVGNSGLTLTGTMMGTPNYMSPEQIKGKTVDRRSDIFAVGLVAYELLAGRQAFSGSTSILVMNAIVHEAAAPLSHVCDWIDPELEEIVARALEKDPALRHQTLAMMGAEIAGVRQRLSTVRRSIVESDYTVALPPPDTPSRRTPRPTDRDPIVTEQLYGIDAYLNDASRAFAAEDFSGAVDACEQALSLDPEDVRALDLLERSRAAFDAQKVNAWLRDAGAFLDHGDLDGAAECVEQALQIDQTSTAAHRLEQRIIDARRQQHQQREREQGTAESARPQGEDVRRRETWVQEPRVEEPRSAAGSLISSRAVKWGAIPAGAAVVVAVGLYLRIGRTDEPPLGPETKTTVATTSIPVTAPPTSIPVEPPPTTIAATTSIAPATAVDVPRELAPVRALLGQRRFSDAMRRLMPISERAPRDPAVAAAVRDVLNGAAAGMTTARQDADRAGRSNTRVFADAARHAQSAVNLRETSEFVQAVEEYVAATRLFVQASQVAVVAPTTVPGAATTTVPPTLSTVPPSVVTTSIATTSVVAGIDTATVERVLQQYAAASRTLDVSTIRGIYPSVPPRTVQRIEALRKDFSFCEYSFANVAIVSNGAEEARIRTEAVESCKPKTAQKAIPQSGRMEFILKKTGAGAWIVAEVFTQQ